MSNTLKITKLGSNKFEHIHNGIVANAFFISDFSATLDGNKFNIVQNDGAVRFTYEVQNITFQDQTTGGSDETFVSPLLLWNRLISVQYTPFFVVPAGLSLDEFDAIHGANNPSSSNVFATMADVGGGGGGGAVDSVNGDLVDNTDPANPIVNTPTLQEVTDKGNSIEDGGTNETTLIAGSIELTKILTNKTVGITADSFQALYFGKLISGAFKFCKILADNVVNNCNFQLPNKADGTYTLATHDEMPTALNQLTDDTTHRTVTDAEKATWNAKQNALGFTPANKAGDTFTGAISATNLSGTNTGDETATTIKSKLGISTLSGSNTGDQDLSGLVTKTTTVNSKALSSNVTLTTADIADSTNKRYQTDAQNTNNDATSSIQTQLNGKQTTLTDVIFGAFSNGLTAKTTPVDADTINLTDSADSNKSKKVSWANLKATLKSYFDGLYSPLYYNYKSTTPSSTLTGTLTETQLLQITIPANTFGANDFLKIPSLTFVKSGTNGGVVFKVKLSTSATMPSGTTGQIATYSAVSTTLFFKLSRLFSIASGNILGYGFTTSVVSDVAVLGSTISSQAFDRTQTQYLYVSATLANVSDSVYLNDIQVTNM